MLREECDDVDVLFQIADVSKPLVSVPAICERGNRVIFGKSGGVIQNIQTGHETPFYRQDGIYIYISWKGGSWMRLLLFAGSLSQWMRDIFFLKPGERKP